MGESFSGNRSSQMACCKRSFANCVSTCQLALSYARTYTSTYQYTHLHTHISWSMSPQNAFPVFLPLKYIPWNIRIFPVDHIHPRLPLHLSLLQLWEMGIITYMSCQLKPVLCGRQLVSRRRIVVWTRVILSKRRSGHQTRLRR